MDQLQLLPAKLLYFATEMHKRKLIDVREKISLKELIIADDSQVYAALEKYERSGNEHEFIENLMARIRGSSHKRQSGIFFDNDSKRS